MGTVTVLAISKYDYLQHHGPKSRKKPFFGYKAHASMDDDSELINWLETTPSNANDGKGFPTVVESKADTVTLTRLMIVLPEKSHFWLTGRRVYL